MLQDYTQAKAGESGTLDACNVFDRENKAEDLGWSI